MIKLNIDTSATVVFSNKLEKMRKSALPNAVRGSLNKAGFDVKQRTMPETAAQTFEKRQPNFFKANSRVEMASGFDIKSMKTIVGFVENRLKNTGKNFAVKDLEQQERGGTIKRRSFIPVDTARSGGSNSKMVRPSNRLSAINKIVNSNTIAGKSPRQKFIKAAARAGVGGYVIGNDKTKILYKVEGLSGGKVKLKALYDYVENRTVSIRGTGFMKKASLQSGNKIEDFYIAEAKRQIERLQK